MGSCVSPQHGSGMIRVLIVDDDPAKLRQMAALTAALGYEVLTAAGGEAALSMLRTDRTIAVVVLDLVMPDRDGMAVLESLAREPFAPPAIVAATAPSAETDRQPAPRGSGGFHREAGDARRAFRWRSPTPLSGESWSNPCGSRAAWRRPSRVHRSCHRQSGHGAGAGARRPGGAEPTAGVARRRVRDRQDLGSHG